MAEAAVAHSPYARTNLKLANSADSKASTIAALRQSMERLESRQALHRAVQPVPDALAQRSGELQRSVNTGLPVPAGLTSILPDGLRVGAAQSIVAEGAVLAALVAEVTRQGKHVGIIGMPEFALLSVREQGGDLSRVVCVDDPGNTPLETAGVLIDGVSLLVLRLPAVPIPSKSRPLMARLRNAECALLYVGAVWPGSCAVIESRVDSIGGIERRGGRITEIRYRVTASRKGRPECSGLWSVGYELPGCNSSKPAAAIRTAPDVEQLAYAHGSADDVVIPFPIKQVSG